MILKLLRQVDAKMDILAQRLDELTARAGANEWQLVHINQQIIRLNLRMTHIETRIAHIEEHLFPINPA